MIIPHQLSTNQTHVVCLPWVELPTISLHQAGGWLGMIQIIQVWRRLNRPKKGRSPFCVKGIYIYLKHVYLNWLLIKVCPLLIYIYIYILFPQNNQIWYYNRAYQFFCFLPLKIQLFTSFKWSNLNVGSPAGQPFGTGRHVFGTTQGGAWWWSATWNAKKYGLLLCGKMR